MSHAKYLVQARQGGEPWKTFGRSPVREQAEALADILAAQARHYGGPIGSVPQHPYVRVTFAGATVYDPRATAKKGRAT